MPAPSKEELISKKTSRKALHAMVGSRDAVRCDVMQYNAEICEVISCGSMWRGMIRRNANTKRLKVTSVKG